MRSPRCYHCSHSTKQMTIFVGHWLTGLDIHMCICMGAVMIHALLPTVGMVLCDKKTVRMY